MNVLIVALIVVCGVLAGLLWLYRIWLDDGDALIEALRQSCDTYRADAREQRALNRAAQYEIAALRDQLACIDPQTLADLTERINFALWSADMPITERDHQ